MKFMGYPKIRQLRNVIKPLSKITSDPVTFTGTVKVHGTNGGVTLDPLSRTMTLQSRKRILTPQDDNMGFAAWATLKEEVFWLIYRKINVSGMTVKVYGEWAGKGVQSGVAVSNVEKFFYVFGVAVQDFDTTIWLKDYPSLTSVGDNILDARDVIERKIVIRPDAPELIVSELIDLTMQIEEECPVGKFFGYSGTGEGMVWEHITEGGNRLAFKVKGEKHSTSKVKVLASVDPEMVKSVQEFVTYAVTENRMLQGFQEACDCDANRKNADKFLRWISKDIQEEETDTLEESGLIYQDVAKNVMNVARSWFFGRSEEC